MVVEVVNDPDHRGRSRHRPASNRTPSSRSVTPCRFRISRHRRASACVRDRSQRCGGLRFSRPRNRSSRPRRSQSAVVQHPGGLLPRDDRRRRDGVHRHGDRLDSAYFGGWIDTVLMRFADLILLVPLLPVLIVVSALFRISLPLLGLLIGFLGGSVAPRSSSSHRRCRCRSSRSSMLPASPVAGTPI